MTTKYKIISGFVLMMLLLAGVAFFGYTTMEDTTKGFQDYRTRALFNVATSDITTNMNDAAYRIYQFAAYENVKEMDQSRASVKESLEIIQRTKKIVTNKARLAALEGLEKHANQLTTLSDSIQENMIAASALYTNSIQVKSGKIIAELHDLANAAAQIDNAQGLAAISNTLFVLIDLEESLARYSESRRPNHAERLEKTLEAMDAALKVLEPTLQTTGGKAIFALISGDYNDYKKDIAQLIKHNVQIEKHGLDEVDRILQDVLVAATALSGEANKQE